jgi:hypothetical protein
VAVERRLQGEASTSPAKLAFAALLAVAAFTYFKDGDIVTTAASTIRGLAYAAVVMTVSEGIGRIASRAQPSRRRRDERVSLVGAS